MRAAEKRGAEEGFLTKRAPSALARAFGEVVFMLREDANMSHAALASAANITTSALEKIEFGRVDPLLDVIDELAGVLGETPASLVCMAQDLLGRIPSDELEIRLARARSSE